RALDLVDHRAPFGMAELEIFVGDPFAAVLFDQDLRDLGHLAWINRSEEHTSELQSHLNLVCRLLLEKKKVHDVFRAAVEPSCQLRLIGGDLHCACVELAYSSEVATTVYYRPAIRARISSTTPPRDDV